jgi:hypothetical protein
MQHMKEQTDLSVGRAGGSGKMDAATIMFTHTFLYAALEKWTLQLLCSQTFLYAAPEKWMLQPLCSHILYYTRCRKMDAETIMFTHTFSYAAPKKWMMQLLCSQTFLYAAPEKKMTAATFTVCSYELSYMRACGAG